MKDKDLYSKMTVRKLFITLSKIKSTEMNNKVVIRPLTKDQKELFEAFDIELPD
jgi:hypothetical protein